MQTYNIIIYEKTRVFTVFSNIFEDNNAGDENG
jgi:hypothetical protein